MLQFPKACLLLVTFLLEVTFPAWPESYTDQRPQVVVSVYDDAGVSVTVLAEAEQRAARIFADAGLDIAWRNCSSPQKYVGPDALVRAAEGSSPGFWGSAVQRNFAAVEQRNLAGLRPAGRVKAPAPTRSELDCVSFEWPTRLAVRIVSRPVLPISEVFGVAFLSAEGTGCYTDVFYDRATKLHTDWNVGLSDLLGNVVAHELGHLLLGSSSHSRAGIMQAHWQGEELNLLSRGHLRFTREQSEQMRRKLNRVRQRLALAARSSF